MNLAFQGIFALLLTGQIQQLQIDDSLFYIFFQKISFAIHANCLPRSQYVSDAKAYFLEKRMKVNSVDPELMLQNEDQDLI